MIRSTALLLLGASIFAACGAPSSTTPPTAPPVHATASSPCDVTPPASGASIFDLRTLRRVQSVRCLGRVPLGMINVTGMQSADAWFDRFVAGDDLRQSATLHLSIVLGVHIERRINDSTGASYQWWFYNTPQTSAFTATLANVASIKLALRFVAGSWAVYADNGDGWAPVPMSSFQFGDHEVSAVVPVDPAWGMARDASTFFRAVTASTDSSTADPPRGPGEDGEFGDVYPTDLTGQRLFDY